MSEYKEYHLVNGDHVRAAELRETPKMFIAKNDFYGKFKKLENDQNGRLASNRRKAGWSSHTGYDVYELNSPYVLDLIEKEKQKYFVFNVRQALEKKVKEIKTYEQAMSINDVLGLGVKK